MSAKYKAADGVIEYNGIRLPNLKGDTAIEYHNTCISYLLELFNHPEHMQDENLLATAAILRFYEVLDTPADGKDEEDEERFLRIFQGFTTSQASFACSTTTSEIDMSYRTPVSNPTD